MGEKLKKCEKCGRMFSGAENIIICSRCMTDDEETFRVVREYIYDNPGCNAKTVSEGTGVPHDVILKYLKQGRLELKGDGVGYGCDMCDTNITYGRYCEKCAAELAKGLKKAGESLGKGSAVSRDSEYRVKKDAISRR